MNMKKTIIMMTLCLVAFCSPVQAQHLKFMGIPLNGTITQFQQKLTAKGVKYNKTTSELLPEGTRAFQGTFAGEKADIYVHYDPISKIVFNAKAVMTYASESMCESKYDEFKHLLSSKYDAVEIPDYKDGHEVMNYVIKSENATSLNDFMGYISIYILKEETYFYEYTLHIEYADDQNTEKNANSKMNDL